MVCPSLLPGTDKASGPIGISLTLTPPTSSGKPEPPPVPFVTAVDDSNLSSTTSGPVMAVDDSNLSSVTSPGPVTAVERQIAHLRE